MKKNNILKGIVFCLLILFAGGIGRLWYQAKDGFALQRLGAAFPALTVGQAPAIDELRGPFRYLGRGRQCYAFESLDGRWVLKLPRFDRYQLPFFWKLPFSFLDPWRKQIAADRQSRFVFTLESFRIAAEELQKETAVRYLHLEETRGLSKTLLFDKMGRRFEIDLNRTAFILQEKKPLMMPQLLSALRARDEKKAERILSSFLKIIQQRARVGVFNKDPSFLKNFAWEEGEGVQIDIGSFYRKEGLEPWEAYQLSMRESCTPLREWLGSLDPTLLSRFDQRLDAACEEPSF